MSKLELFPKDKVVGIFKGFSQGGMEFHADIVLPYRSEFQSVAMHGQFLLVQLSHEDEAVLGRITSLYSDGRLASGAGEDYSLRVVEEDRTVPEDLREQYLKYRVNIRVLGLLRLTENELVFAASHRRLPHVGSKVAFPSPDVLKEIAGHNVKGADLGFLALGEFIYAAGDKRLELKPWMQSVSPVIVAKFPITDLVSRRSFVFARAGFGKSNLNKLLFSNLYRESPMVTKRGGRQVPVGTIIFDPDGEYYWPDDKNRPGLCDVPELEDKIVVFTRKVGPSPFYQSFVAGNIKLDIRRLTPADVISIALSPEKQDQQNVRKLKGLAPDAWESLVNEVDQHGNLADLEKIKSWLHLDNNSEAEAVAARSNMTTIVRMLHDKSSRMIDMLISALRAGKLCIIDISQLRGGPSLVLTGLILRRIFDINQREFTEKEPKTIPTIAVLEEAQSVLGQGSSSGEGPYVEWVKEGRKYDLGAVMITQQPGSIPVEILSQGDNWFIFHLLSAADLQAVKRANAHFSDDLLSSLLNEPIPGHGVFWSSVSGKPYPIPIRVISFEDSYSVRDLAYNLPPGNTFAARLREDFKKEFERAAKGGTPPQTDPQNSPSASSVPKADPSQDRTGDSHGPTPADEPVDTLELFRVQAISSLRKDAKFLSDMTSDGCPWGAIKGMLAIRLPAHLEDRDQIAFNLVRRALNEIFGEEQWQTEKRPSRTGDKSVTWAVLNQQRSHEKN